METSDKLSFNYEKYDFKDAATHAFKSEKGLSEQVVREISSRKEEPEWMLNYRLKALAHFFKRPMPTWGVDLSGINFDDLHYYVKPDAPKADNWDMVPEQYKKAFDRLGIPEAEKKFLSGSGAQYDSENIIHTLNKELAEKGVIFSDVETALKEQPELVKQYFGKVIPYNDNKFSALNSAVWSGGSFVYIPKGVSVELPLQAYFRINASNVGQFERTLIIAEEGSSVHYLEGCSAPIYSAASLHSAVVEIIAKPSSRVQYTTIQNWSNNVYNLVTKRAFAYANSNVFWLDGNLGCLTGDSAVFAKGGVIPIKDIEVGDIVYSIGKNFGVTENQVVAKKQNPPSPVFKLVTENHREIRATANHPFLVLSKKGKFNFIEWKPLEEVRAGDQVACAGLLPQGGQARRLDFVPKARKGLKKIKVPSETSTELMWLVGFYLGDGYCDKNRVYFAVPESDRSRNRVKKAVEELFGFTEHENHKVVVRFNSTAMVDFFSHLGLKGNARTKRLPEWIFGLPIEQKKAVIEGYIDADGHRRKGHKNVSITSVNKPLLEAVKLLAISCSLNPTKLSKWSRREKKPMGKEEKLYEHYFLYFGDHEFEKPVYFARVTSKEFCGEEITYDIEVEGDHNFIANGIFVHNSRVTMKYPSIYLLGEGARAEILSLAYAGKGQQQDSGGKAVHLAPNTTSIITSKSVCKDGGRTSYRGLLKVAKGCTGVKSSVRCDALILDELSRSDTYPYMEIEEEQVSVGHEATVGKIGEEQLFYLMSRGLTESEALALIVLGFIDEFKKRLPMEYAVEINRLIEMDMAGSGG